MDDIYSYESSATTGIDSEDSQDDYKLATQGNIQDYVRWQLNLRRLSTIDMLMAEYLIDSMDERGFITLSNDELFQSFDTMLSFYQIENVDLAKTLSLWLSKYKTASHWALVREIWQNAC